MDNSKSVPTPVAGNRFTDARFVALVFLGVLWVQLFASLAPFWTQGAYYDYGWFVPPAAAWFAWCRIEALTRFKEGEEIRARWLIIPLLLLLGVFLLFLFPLRVIEKNELLWRLPRFIHFFCVAGITHLYVAAFYSIRRSLYFVPVTIFTLTAVPLPLQLEMGFIQNATDVLMAISEPICLGQGFPVELSGSALIMKGEVLEINEGCSGIRSFQSTIMLGLFLGEFFLLHWSLRILTLLLGIMLAFLVNILRVVALTKIYFERGEDAFHHYHDLVGYLAFALSAAVLIGVALAAGRIQKYVSED